MSNTFLNYESWNKDSSPIKFELSLLGVGQTAINFLSATGGLDHAERFVEVVSFPDFVVFVPVNY